MTILNTDQKIDNELSILKELDQVKTENVNTWIDKTNKKSRRLKQIKQLSDLFKKKIIRKMHQLIMIQEKFLIL